jgi:L-ornithine N5-oxygenase
MSQSSQQETIKDMIGVGFGPSNLALAIALEELAESRGHALDALFIDKQQDYRWHGETLATQSELQISFLKDLVSLRNPTSPYSFVNYLHQKQRLADFINLGTFYPCRLEYNDYLRWAAEHFATQAVYGRKCCASNRTCMQAGSNTCA